MSGNNDAQASNSCDSKRNFYLKALENLEKAMLSGVKEVQYSDKKIVYRSRKEMERDLEYIKCKLGIGSTSRRNRGLFGGRRVVARPSKGLSKCDGSLEHGEFERFDRNEEI